MTLSLSTDDDNFLNFSILTSLDIKDIKEKGQKIKIQNQNGQHFGFLTQFTEERVKRFLQRVFKADKNLTFLNIFPK